MDGDSGLPTAPRVLTLCKSSACRQLIFPPLEARRPVPPVRQLLALGSQGKGQIPLDGVQRRPPRRQRSPCWSTLAEGQRSAPECITDEQVPEIPRT